MVRFLSIFRGGTFRGGCKALLTSLTSAHSTFKKWVHREVRPALDGIASAIHRLYHFRVRPVISRFFQFVCDHWIAIALGTLSILVIIWPGIFTASLLAFLGFAVLGPAAGTVAPFVQSIFGTVAAGSAFSIFQSAGMLGFGLVIINSVVMGIAALALFMVLIYLITEWRKQ